MTNNLFYLRSSVKTCCMIISILSSLAFAGGIDTIQVLKISAQDGRAVIKTAEGKSRIIKAGDVLRIAGSEMRVVEIAAGRVVFEENGVEEPETIIVRLENGKQRVERGKRTGEKMPHVRALPKNEQEQRGQKKEK